MSIHDSIRRRALRGIAGAVLGFGVLGAGAQAQEPIRVGVTVTQSPPGSVIQGTEVLRGLEIDPEAISPRQTLSQLRALAD